MKYKFTKMQGTGNDYIFFDCLKNKIEYPETLSVILSRRRFSVGSDGIVLILPSKKYDAAMEIYNSDGSEGKMCGNAIRCVAKYLYDKKIVRTPDMQIDTKSGVRDLFLFDRCGETFVTVNIGKATFLSDIPDIFYENKKEDFECVNVGNLHSVVFCENPEKIEISKAGTFFENNPAFPERVNTEFVRIEKDFIEMRVFEKGSGETLSCGTGASASVAAAVKRGYFGFSSPVTVKLKGGELEVLCDRNFNLTLTGNAVTVYEGVYYDKDE